MSLSPENLEWLEGLSGEEEKAILALFVRIIDQFEAEVLGCSLGTAADPQVSQKLVALKQRHEGALQAQRLFQSELQRVRKDARDNRMAASNANPTKGKK